MGSINGISVGDINDIIRMFTYEPMDSITATSIERLIRERCPGEYKVVFTPSEFAFDQIKLEFDDPEEAVAFKLRHW